MKILGVSAGAGIILHPFKDNKKFKILGNYEVRKDFVTREDMQWKLNFEGIPLWKSEELNPNLKPDIILSQPSCGNYSVLSHSRTGKKVISNNEPSLTLFFNSIELYKPKLFLLENLPALIQSINKVKIKRKFPEYKFIYHIGSVSDWGNSQITRKRLIMIGIRKDTKFSLKDFPPFKVHDKLKNTGELLKGTQDINGEQPEHFCNYNESDFSKSIAIFGGKQMTIGDIRSDLKPHRAFIGTLKINSPLLQENLIGNLIGKEI